ncbi:MAG: type II toxin-antitoxin system HicA family toxin [Hyphomicrobiales bacterium]|nr:type II toxin-antitoxin system HicA family toxin [Hyphomicrobiales bacterium]
MRFLEEANCRFARTGKGSHQIWYSPITNRNFVVPTNIVSRHTANGVLRDAGLPKQF